MSATFRTLRPLARSTNNFVARTAAPMTTTTTRGFHASSALRVAAGDALPNVDALCEDSPGNKVNLADEFKNTRGVVIGVPAAFSGACSQQHVPGYMKHPQTKEILGMGGKVFVVSVNDAFVMKAWHAQLDPVKESGIRFLGDPSGAFTRALDLGFDGSAIFGGMRGKRYALLIEDGKVKSAHVEPDNTGTNVSLAENVLG